MLFSRFGRSSTSQPSETSKDTVEDEKKPVTSPATTTMATQTLPHSSSGFLDSACQFLQFSSSLCAYLYSLGGPGGQEYRRSAFRSCSLGGAGGQGYLPSAFRSEKNTFQASVVLVSAVTSYQIILTRALQHKTVCGVSASSFYNVYFYYNHQGLNFPLSLQTCPVSGLESSETLLSCS